LTFAEQKNINKFTIIIKREKKMNNYPPGVDSLPFDKPEIEMDECPECEGKGCKHCKFTGEIELDGDGY